MNLESNFNFKLSESNTKKVLDIINRFKETDGPLINIMQEIQNEFHFLPFSALELVSEELNIPLEEIFGVATFYAQFKLQETGKYQIGICQGTVCYVKGSEEILNEVSSLLGIKDGEKTEDGNFSLDTTRCIGACGLAPVLTINDKVYGHVKKEDISKILDEYKG